MKKTLFALASILTLIAAGVIFYTVQSDRSVVEKKTTPYYGPKISNLFLKKKSAPVEEEKKRADATILKRYIDSEISFSYPGDTAIAQFSSTKKEDEIWTTQVYEDGTPIAPVTIIRRSTKSLDEELKNLAPYISSQKDYKTNCGNAVKLTLTNNGGAHTEYLFYNGVNLYTIVGWEAGDYEDNDKIASTFNFVDCTASTSSVSPQ